MKYLPGFFVAIAVIYLLHPVTCQNSDNESCQSYAKELLERRYGYGGYSSFVDLLHDICIRNVNCAQAYYQHDGKNVTIFKFLVKELIDKYKRANHAIYFDQLDVMSEIVCNGISPVTNIAPLLSSTRYAQYSAEEGATTDNVIASYLETNALYAMYSHATASNPTCGLNQKMIVSHDGMTVSCSCGENMNCASSVHNTTYINVSVALVIFFVVLLLAVLSFNTAYHIRVLENFQKRKDPTVLARLIRY
jgi:hypothetical protein